MVHQSPFRPSRSSSFGTRALAVLAVTVVVSCHEALAFSNLQTTGRPIVPLVLPKSSTTPGLVGKPSVSVPVSPTHPFRQQQRLGAEQSYPFGAVPYEAEPIRVNPVFEKPGVGIKRDLQMRLPFFKSDITDGFNLQVCVSCEGNGKVWPGIGWVYVCVRERERESISVCASADCASLTTFHFCCIVLRCLLFFLLVARSVRCGDIVPFLCVPSTSCWVW